jgi:hypothetical protein
MKIVIKSCGGKGCQGHEYSYTAADFAFTSPSTNGVCENCQRPDECGVYAGFNLCIPCIRAATIGYGLAGKHRREEKP